MVPDNFLLRCVLIFRIKVGQGRAVLAAGKEQKNRTEYHFIQPQVIQTS